MNLKEFLKPTRIKILLFIAITLLEFLFILSYIYSQSCFCPYLPEEIPICPENIRYSLPWEYCCPEYSAICGTPDLSTYIKISIYNVILAPFDAISWVAHIIAYYFFTCFILWMFSPQKLEIEPSYIKGKPSYTKRKNLRKLVWVVLLPIIVIVVFYILYNFYLSLSFMFCAKENFPKTYDTENIIIFSSSGTKHMISSILIYGNGSAYYGKYADPGEEETKAGVLSEEKINEIISMFRDKAFFCLNEYYYTSPNYFRYDNCISITINNVTKTIQDWGRGAPSQFYSIVGELENNVRNLPSISPSNMSHLSNEISLRRDLCDNLKRKYI